MWYRRDFSRETMRDFSLARSLVSQGWSREKSRSRENPIDTLRDATLKVSPSRQTQKDEDKKNTVNGATLPRVGLPVGVWRPPVVSSERASSCASFGTPLLSLRPVWEKLQPFPRRQIGGKSGLSAGVSGIGRYKLSPPTFGCVYTLPTVVLCGIHPFFIIIHW